jgi:hypothetical protein
LAYHEVVADTRTRPGTDRRPLISYLRVQADHDREMLRILRQSNTKINAELKRLTARSGIGAAVRRDQLALSQRAINQEMATLWARVGDHTAAGRANAAAAAVRSTTGLTALRGVLPAADLDYMLRSAEASARRGIATLEARLGLSQIPLAQSVYKNTALSTGKVDGIINAALARGASAKELADDVRQYIRPDVRGGVSYAAMRLGRTELNNAFHAQQVQTGINEPWTTGLLWNLSGSHPRPDECNEYADSSHYTGGRAGVYKPEDVPAKPHPNCLCFTTPEVDDREEFMRKFEEGHYDDFLDEEFPDLPSRAPTARSSAAAKASGWTGPRYGSQELTTQMAAADRQRQALMDARYIAKGRRKGHYNPETGYDVPGAASARQAYTEMANREMNALSRNPAKFAAENDDAWVAYTAEQNELVDGLMAKNALSEDVVLGRAMTGDFGHLAEGSYFADPGFLSATTDIDLFLANPSTAFGERVAAGEQVWTFIMQVPKGTNALPGADWQKEIFLKRGARQQIVEVDHEHHVIYTKVVN